MKVTAVKPIGPLVPYVCTYRKDGTPWCITLWGTDEDTVLMNCGDLLPELRIDGILDSVIEP